MNVVLVDARRTIDARNPRTGEIDYQISAASHIEIAEIAARLRAGQLQWSAIDARRRADILFQWADAIESNAAALTSALSVDTGRLAIAHIEVISVVGTLRRWAATGPAIIAAMEQKDMPSATPGITISNRHVAYPLFGAIAPWNFPLLLALIDAVPALLAGCAALIKPSEITQRFIPELRKTIAAIPQIHRRD